MSSNADAILASLIGEVETKYGGPVDIAEIIAKSDAGKRELSPPKLLVETVEKKKSHHKHKNSDGHKSKKRDKDEIYVRTLPKETPWRIEPIKMMPTVDDIPVGGDFTLYHSKIKENPEKGEKKKDKKEKKDKEKHHKEKKEKRHKHKKKSKETEEKERLELVPSTLLAKNIEGSAVKNSQKNDQLEEGEIVEGWMSLDHKRVEDLKTTDDILKAEMDKRRKERKKQKKEKERIENEAKEKDLAEKEKKKKEKEEKKAKKKEKEREKSKELKSRSDGERKKVERYEADGFVFEGEVERDDYHERLEKHREDRRSSQNLKASGSLDRLLSPRSNSQSKLLPTTWSKHLNGLLKSSNDEFVDKGRSESRHRETDDRRSRRRSVESERRHDRRDSRYHEVDDTELPKRGIRSRSRTPSIGRGRNYFRRTDEEWKEHQRDRIRRRRFASPVQIFEEDYTDRYGRVDKNKLLDIATRNVTKLAMSGALPKGYELLSTIKSKTVDQLIKLCKQLHDEDERARADRPSSSDESDDDERCYARYWEENRSFSLKEPQEVPKPRYEMIDGIPQQIKTADERRADAAMLRVTYPVSSGYEHRQKELEPMEDEVPTLPLMTALARIKTNIPSVFPDALDAEIAKIINPVKPNVIPLPQSISSFEQGKSLMELSEKISTETGHKPSVVASVLSGTATLPKPIEIVPPVPTTPDGSTIVQPTTPVIAQKPIRIRASFLKSGKKAVEEALQKINSVDPTPVPAPEVVVNDQKKDHICESIAMLMPSAVQTPVVEPEPMIVEEKVVSETKEVTHSDALSALLDRVDALVNTGMMEELSTVEKKEISNENEKLEEKQVETEDYVKIPGLNEAKIIAAEKENVKKSKEKKHKEKKKKKDKEKSELEVGEVVDGETEKKKRKHSESPKKKKRKSENDELNLSVEKKRKKGSDSTFETATMNNIGPEQPKVPEFNHRDPLPFIKALTSNQLAIEDSKSLKAEWNDPRNPLVLPPVFINDDDSMPMPFRIIPPTREQFLKPEEMVFKTPSCITNPPKMINELVKKRAQFASALAANPNDYYAKKRIADIDREMSSWAESKNIPGRFTGRTGARVLSVDELAPSDPRYNAWARKDLFCNAPEHDSEFGRKIMEKFGWQKGIGLGRTMSGPLEPLKLDIKSDRRGLSATTDRKPGKNSLIADINGKNPISLVMEYCAQKRLQPPTFTCIESGPSSSRRFLWKCNIDGVEYEPAMAAANKKAGKTEVCYVVLQALGQVPPTIPD